MTSLSEIKTLAQNFVTDARNVLSRSKSEREICAALQKIGSLLLQSGDSSDFKDLLKTTDLPDHDMDLARKQIRESHYVHFLNYLCNILNFEWYSNFGRSQEGNRLFNSFFLKGRPEDALLVLCSVIQNSSPSFKQKKCVLLLEEFFHQHQLQMMLCSMCDISPGSATCLSTSPCSSRSMALDGQRSQVLTVLVTIPDRIANVMKKDCSDFFYPDHFIPMVAKEILKTLHYVHEKLSKSENASLQFVSELIGRLCIQGYTERLFGILLPQLLKLTSSNFIWCRIANRILAGAPDRSLEVILEYLLRHCPWYGYVARLLSDAVLTNAKINFLLTNKFLLLRHFADVIVPQNLIGYLASSPSRRHLIVKVLRSVLNTWGDRSAVKHTSHSQHAYLTMVIVISVGHLNEEEKAKHKGDLTTMLMGGVQAHLESPILRVRRLGMVTAEIMAKTLDPNGPKLAFEYKEDEESQLLWSLVNPPEDPGLDSLIKGIDQVAIESDMEMSNGTEDRVECRVSDAPNQEQEKEEELDSDDEFEPYDMSHDTEAAKVKVPVYIRDCIDGLTARDAPELTEASLKVAEKLIRAKPDDLKDVCSQFVAILLHLEDQYNTENFRFLRHSAMVALSVNCPIETSKYLTGEFYNRNYNIRQRMDILEVLAAAAQELSKPSEDPGPASKSSGIVNPQEHKAKESQEENWRDIVQKRIESKTRRFAKGPSKPAPNPAINRFAPVAGHFFFPLLKSYDSKLNTMDLLGNDFLLLGRLMYTLGIIMYAAQNTPICRQMAVSLLDFIWSLRYHTEQYVRQSLMFAVSMVTLSVPAHLLVTDLQSDILECRHWLQDILEKDPEPECKALAAQTLLVIDSTVSKELKGKI
ncbi:telomere length regulation protein TEL2 homolog [Lytechinus variegatus]|uniref:telomere length regulation protein TEL2 homolog n=1 Tax=Lytechinus variegatus TaxID=7654 RepID=UPI001BB1CB2F|nr:telomere length regulation protein TEL2 homolog [Lytechinus variegatus]